MECKQGINKNGGSVGCEGQGRGDSCYADGNMRSK